MPNRTFPEFWRHDPQLCALKRDTRLFFFYLALSVDDYWRCGVGPSPQEPEFLRSTCYPLNRDVRTADVARWLHELKQAGAILVSDSERGWYVEIVESLRYRRDDYKEGQPKYGPRHQRPPAQKELPNLGPVALGPPPTQVKRIRVDHGHAHESPPATPPPPQTRVLSHGEDSARFARWIEDIPHDDAWRDLCEAVGSTEMHRSGAAWKLRFETHRGSVVRALEDFTVQSPADRAAIANVGAYLNQRFGAHLKHTA